MKNIFLSLISLAFLACVSDDNFSTPSVCEGGKCQTSSLSNAAIPFNESFDNFALWQVANTEGERKWYLKQHDGKPFATMSAFDGQNQPGVTVQAWLISPLFDFDTQKDETLEFKLADYYSNDNPLKVFYSIDYDGTNIKRSTWKQLTVPNNNTLFNNDKKADYNYESSGNINLSDIKGKAVIAFVYDSNGGKITSTAQLSEVHITVGKKEEPPTASKLQSAAIPFNETFDKGLDEWQIQNTQGTRKWLKREYNKVSYINMSAYVKDKPGVAVQSWLISPQFNFDGQESETLEFKMADAYSASGNPLKLMYSYDYDGTNIKQAIWKELIVPNNLFNNSGRYDNNYESSGNIDLSGIKGKAVIAFVYDSNGGKITSTAQLSEVHITVGKKEAPTSESDSEETSLDTTGEESTLVILAFVGGDFETEMNLNKSGLKNYAAYESGAGIKGSKALHIETSGTSKNDYVFTTLAPDNLPNSYTRLTFKLKGTAASKSISINLYKEGDGRSYYAFNFGDVTDDKEIKSSPSSSYTGSINVTDWITITLDLNGISDLNTDSSKSFLALKIGKGSAFDILLDNFYIE